MIDREMLVSAAERVIAEQRASTVLLQRRLYVSFVRAEILLRGLERMGVVAGIGTANRTVLLADFDRAAIGQAADVHLGVAPCCDLHGRHCEAPSELCCEACTEVAHDALRGCHQDGSRCVLDTTKEGR